MKKYKTVMKHLKSFKQLNEHIEPTTESPETVEIVGVHDKDGKDTKDLEEIQFEIDNKENLVTFFDKYGNDYTGDEDNVRLVTRAN